MTSPHRANRRIAGPVLLVLAGLAAGCGTAPTGAPTTPVPTPAATQTVTPTPPPTAVATPSPAPTTAGPTPTPPTAIGARIPVLDQQFLTVITAEEWPGTTALKPATGYIFVTLNVKIEAVKATTVAVADFPMYDGTGHKYAPASAGRTPQLAPVGSLAAGASSTGYLTYVVPKDVGMADLILSYAPAFLGGSVNVRLLQ